MPESTATPRLDEFQTDAWQAAACSTLFLLPSLRLQRSVTFEVKLTGTLVVSGLFLFQGRKRGAFESWFSLRGVGGTPDDMPHKILGREDLKVQLCVQFNLSSNTR